MAKHAKLHHTNKTTNQIRIIGGRFKRRGIGFVDADGLRPTPDRLRETLFNWLMPDIHGARVLDVCAGSGVLGFESLSRGATHATLIEPNKTQAQLIRHHADNLRLTSDELSIINNTAQYALPMLTTPFDIIFIDPPYSLNIWGDLMVSIIDHKLYHANTLFYIESDGLLDDVLQPFIVSVLKTTKIGQVHAALFMISFSQDA